jgi:hypothetical protein
MAMRLSLCIVIHHLNVFTLKNRSKIYCSFVAEFIPQQLVLNFTVPQTLIEDARL